MMSFALKPHQSLGKGIRRIARKQMEDAREQVAGNANGSRDEAVHEARKCFKKVRALLRLVRPVISVRTYRHENTALRDAARPLTEVRDAEILVETLDKVIQHFAERVHDQSFAPIRNALMAYHREVRARVLDDENAFATVETAVRKALARLEDWTDVPNRWASVGDGIQRVYRQARRAFTEAIAEPTVENLHEWRKQTKYLRYQLELFVKVWPEIMEPLIEQADHLGELLGNDHDLAVLHQKLTQDPERFGGEEKLELLFTLIDQRRKELEEEAHLLGQRLFQDSPQDFAERVKGYWRVWRKAYVGASADTNAA